jgi:DNA ligase D-like protein (predicted ligase)
MIAALKKLTPEVREKLRRKKHPRWMSPMLATLTKKRFSDPGWIYERKLDGERCLVFRKGSEIRLMSRNKKKINVQYPELVEALERQKTADFVADGEVVAFEGRVTSFSRLQARMHVEEARESRVAVYYYLFDLLFLEGHDLTGLELRHRKGLLKKILDYQDPLRFLPHRNERGEAYYKEACRKGWEGIIAKDAAAGYVHKRSRKWLKFKCVHRQEFVIGGYTEPHGERIGFGALLIGYYDEDRLVYAGKVGTGYDDDTLRRLSRQLASRERKTPPFAGEEELPSKEVHWVTPKLVCEIGFTEWTSRGRLRHPRFLGLRRDKDPERVVMEELAR